MIYIGIDIGGTNIKAGIVDKTGKVLTSESVKTRLPRPHTELIDDMGKLMVQLIADAGLKDDDITAIGIGSPGLIDSQKGDVIFASNLDWHNVPLTTLLGKFTSRPVYLSNDANVAVLGEWKFGAGHGVKNIILVTLGTGIGGGIIIDGKLFEGYKSAGTEIGHHRIGGKGLPCSCGRHDCWEAYCSATALAREAKEVMLKHKDSLMWNEVNGDIDQVEGRTPFDAADKGDPYAKQITDEYLEYLADGIANMANIFRPEIVLLGGGVSNRGAALVEPVQKLLDQRVYGGSLTPHVKVKIASLGNDAGVMGAAALAMERWEEENKK